MNVNIKELSLTELKAFVYDEMAKAQLAQRNIELVNAEIFKRSQEKEEEKHDDA